ncbi:hypothetical protein RQP53_03625 [Paucibacter sp. APW11]|uniref:Uncharacterized protein n=1 Tax=Roseateles aquae TaxID=3077235 RepID=A0ABU3P8F1_9BURK|nr:hypothetical protein [Paucibacter sp. APW11]MDT8998363.1 hypothetical protein [Paucibacter sp. APW11]
MSDYRMQSSLGDGRRPVMAVSSHFPPAVIVALQDAASRRDIDRIDEINAELAAQGLVRPADDITLLKQLRAARQAEAVSA